MGSEPNFATWPQLSNTVITVELCRLLAGRHESPAACMAAIRRAADRVVAPLRGR